MSDLHHDRAALLSVLAAPIFAALLTPFVSTGRQVSAEELSKLRDAALIQAEALLLEARDRS